MTSFAFIFMFCVCMHLETDGLAGSRESTCVHVFKSLFVYFVASYSKQCIYNSALRTCPFYHKTLKKLHKMSVIVSIPYRDGSLQHFKEADDSSTFKVKASTKCAKISQPPRPQVNHFGGYCKDSFSRQVYTEPWLACTASQFMGCGVSEPARWHRDERKRYTMK